MAIRARRLSDARAQARSNPELAWWVFMRLSGVFLVVLTFFHLFSNYIVVSELAADYEYVAARYAMVTERLYLFALLALGVLHGANGMRYGIDDLTARNPRLRFWVKWSFYTVTAAVFVFGALALFTGSLNRPHPIPGVDG
jgi:succinate dehydrogenase / fumarate reductase membrane anchor subunit